MVEPNIDTTSTEYESDKINHLDEIIYDTEEEEDDEEEPYWLPPMQLPKSDESSKPNQITYDNQLQMYNIKEADIVIHRPYDGCDTNISEFQCLMCDESSCKCLGYVDVGLNRCVCWNCSDEL